MDIFKDEIGFGGFLLDNIANWLMKECFESGDPENFFDNILDIVDYLDNDRRWIEEGWTE